MKSLERAPDGRLSALFQTSAPRVIRVTERSKGSSCPYSPLMGTCLMSTFSWQTSRKKRSCVISCSFRWGFSKKDDLRRNKMLDEPPRCHNDCILSIDMIVGPSEHPDNADAVSYPRIEKQQQGFTDSKRQRAGDVIFDGHTSFGSTTVAKKYVWMNQSVKRDDYPHKRSMMSWDKAECRVTDLIQPFTYILPDSIRRPRGDVGGNRSASPAPIYDAEFRLFSVMVG